MRKNSYLMLLFVLIILLVTLKLSDLGDISWDESVYIGMGKYLVSAGNIGLWEALRPVGLPFVLGLLWIGGLNIIYTAKLIGLLFSIGCLVMTYLLGKKLFNGKTAIISAMLLFIAPIFFINSSAVLTDIPSLFFALTSIYLFIDKKLFLAGVFAAISFLFRFPQGILFVALLISQLINKKIEKQAIWGFILTLLPFFVFNFFMYKNPFIPFTTAYEHQFNAVYSVISNTFLSYLYNLFYYPIWIIKQNILLLFSLAGIYFIIKDKNKKSNILLMVVLLFTGYFTFIINKQPRFLIIFLPYICILAAHGILQVANIINPKYLKNAFFILMIIAGVVFSYAYGDYNSIKQDKLGEEFYNFFSHNYTNMTILSTTPIPIAYSNIKMIPLYNNVDDALLIYEKEKNNVNFIMYTSEFYPCFDSLCEEKKQSLFESINNTNQLIYYKKGSQEYYLFKTYTTQ
ncbi:MAG: glycosyltransferase family 39 protein [Nanoarchaeota archaeon]